MAKLRGEFAGVLRELRARARLTQEELAAAAGLSHRTVSDLERGLATTPQKETVRLLGDALNLIGPERARFEAAARGRPLEAASQAAAAAAMRSLPRDVASFTGRQQELEQLAKSALTAGGVVSIHAIGGMAGVGKTAFAVHAAHQLTDQFPGGQVFLPLHGHTPGQAPVDPADALASLLLIIGVPAAQVPPDREARAALWRDRLAGRPLLLVLDDAAGSEQVRPLLPGSGGSLVLVTSRRHLSALDDTTAISLDTLPPDEAATLLVRLAGRPGLSPGDPGVREIIRLCGYLPLAIGMLARQLRQHPAWSAAGRAAELAAARDRLGLIETENLSAAAAFDLSYADLAPDQQRLFRRIGLHPGPDIDGYAAAALDGTGLSAARRGLEALYDLYLLAEPAQGRYQPHDLIREHARALAGRVDSDDDREAATGRLLDYYQHTAAAANAYIVRRTRPTATADGPAPAAVPALADQEQALAWVRAERASLLACLDQAAGAGQHARVTALTAGVSGLLHYDGPWAEAVARHTAAAAAGRQLGDPLSQANALSDLGEAWRVMDDYPAAAQALLAALGLYRDLGNRLGQANALSNLGAVRYLAGDYPPSAQALQEALDLYQDLGDQRGQANALANLGAVRYHAGENRLGAQTLQKALDLYRALGDRRGQANTLNNLGEVRLLMSDYPAAAQAQQEALDLYRDLGDRRGQANALSYLGTVWQATGDYPAAAHAQQEALSVYRDLGNRRGQAMALLMLGLVWRQTGDYPAAVRVLEEALGFYSDLDSRLGRANALYFLGAVWRLTGDYPAAVQAVDEALGLYSDIGDRSGAIEALNERGTLHRIGGELAEARRCHERSLELSREVGSPVDEARSLAGLGRCTLADGHLVWADELLRQALEIFQRVGSPEAVGLLAELQALAGS